MNTLAFDLDGTLIDVWDRYYGLYSGFLVERRCEPLPRETYRELVRAGEPHYRLFREWHGESLYGGFLAHRNARLEAPDQLRLDRCVPGIVPVLERLAASRRLIVVSGRDDREALCGQLDRLGIARLFADVHATAVYGGAEAKAVVLRRQEAAAMIGDTEVDMEAAILAGVPAVAVTWGLREAEVLRPSHPAATCHAPSALEGDCQSATNEA